MKQIKIIIAIMMAIGVLTAVNQAAKEPIGIAPEVNTEGLCVYERVYKMYFTEADVNAMAQMLYGEARGCSLENQQQAVWCVLNRVDNDAFPDSIIGVLSQSGQFHGYSSSFPVWQSLKATAKEVMTRWSLEKQGVDVERELPSAYLWFSGYNGNNVFRSVYQ